MKKPAEDGPRPGGRRRTAAEETERRWQATTPQWPIMHAVTYGVSRDQMMARHKSNHIQVAYANSPAGGRCGGTDQSRHGAGARDGSGNLRDTKGRRNVVTTEAIAGRRSSPPSVLGLAPSFGFGDRVGLATPGHIAAMRRAGAGISPIFAQQSIREMSRTAAAPEKVIDDVQRTIRAM